MGQQVERIARAVTQALSIRSKPERLNSPTSSSEALQCMNGTPEVFRQAVQLHQAGQFAQAESHYRGILSEDPGHTGALHLLGVLLHQ